MLFRFYSGSLNRLKFVDEKEMTLEEATYRCQTEDLFMEEIKQ